MNKKRANNAMTLSVNEDVILNVNIGSTGLSQTSFFLQKQKTKQKTQYDILKMELFLSVFCEN